jgi:hypothetical protein
MGNVIAQRDIQKVFAADEYSLIGIAGAAGIAVAVALAGIPGLAFVAGLAAYAVTLGTALKLGHASLSMTHFVIDAEAEDVTPQ